MSACIESCVCSVHNTQLAKVGCFFVPCFQLLIKMLSIIVDRNRFCYLSLIHQVTQSAKRNPYRD